VAHGRHGDREAGPGRRDRRDDYGDPDARLTAKIRLLLDIQALQNAWSAERGIGRHVHELALALGRGHPELAPWFVVNPDLPLTPAIEALREHGSVAPFDGEPPPGAIYHVPSPLEPVSLDRLWPPGLRASALVVTMHDLIPGLFPDENMPDPAVRRFYWARLELARQADCVLSVSAATARDAVELLGLRPDRIAVTGGGVSDDFRPPASREEALAELARLRPAIDGQFVLYTGGMDWRKNISGLLEAYAGLPDELRRRHRLVIVGRLGLDDPHGPFPATVRRLGISDRVVFTGHVPDEELILLYQAATVFVFPSLYEGFGLPVVEALACGAPAIAGRTSSLVELIEREEALFDPVDPAAIREALVRVLSDRDLLERLRRPDIREEFSWRAIANKTAAAYDEVGRRSRPHRTQTRRSYDPAHGS
jgi:glycosyltransferase involved in cell wall biosynthesis